MYDLGTLVAEADIPSNIGENFFNIQTGGIKVQVLIRNDGSGLVYLENNSNGHRFSLAIPEREWLSRGNIVGLRNYRINELPNDTWVDDMVISTNHLTRTTTVYSGSDSESDKLRKRPITVGTEVGTATQRTIGKDITVTGEVTPSVHKHGRIKSAVEVAVSVPNAILHKIFARKVQSNVAVEMVTANNKRYTEQSQ